MQALAPTRITTGPLGFGVPSLARPSRAADPAAAPFSTFAFPIEIAGGYDTLG